MNRPSFSNNWTAHPECACWLSSQTSASPSSIGERTRRSTEITRGCFSITTPGMGAIRGSRMLKSPSRRLTATIGLPPEEASCCIRYGPVISEATGSMASASAFVEATGSGMSAGSSLITLMFCSAISGSPTISTTRGGGFGVVRTSLTSRVWLSCGITIAGSQEMRQPMASLRTEPSML